MCMVVPTANMLMHHMFILCLWRPEEGIRCLELDLQMLVCYHLVLGIDPSSLEEQPVLLAAPFFQPLRFPTPLFFLIYFGKLVLKNPPFCSVCKFSSVPLNSPQYLCRDTEKKIKTTKCIGYAAKFLLSVHKALGPIASAKEKKNVLSSSLLICALIYSLNTYCQHQIWDNIFSDQQLIFSNVTYFKQFMPGEASGLTV